MVQPELPETVLVIGRNPYEISRRNSDARLSPLSVPPRRLPSLFSIDSKGNRRRSGEESLWNHTRAEKRNLYALSNIKISGVEMSPRVEESRDRSQKYSVPAVNVQPPPTQITATSRPRTANSSNSDRKIIAPLRLDGYSSAPYSMYSYYDLDSGMTEPPPMPTATSSNKIDSPVYGLDGIIGAHPSSSVASETIRHNNESIDDILRKQDELDSSIAALRLFRTGLEAQKAFEPDANLKTPNGLLEADSSSAFSEFSLSVFPDPPTVPDGSSGSNQLVVPRATRPKAQKEARLNSGAIPPPIIVPPVDDQIDNRRLPKTTRSTAPKEPTSSSGAISPPIIILPADSENQSRRIRETPRPMVPKQVKSSSSAIPPPIIVPSVDDDINSSGLLETVGAKGRFPKSGSAGTQYDVTSFIGGRSAACHSQSSLIKNFPIVRSHQCCVHRHDECVQE
jgi:hypothetical protein